jgi:hypothetical protein
MANPEHVKMVMKGAEAIAKWRKQHPKELLDLSGAELIEADLRMADLNRADLNKALLHCAKLSSANLGGANLNGAVLTQANLDLADLSGAHLNGADLWGVNIYAANLSGANLGGTNLGFANIVVADLSGTDFTNSECDATIFSDCNLCLACGLEAVVHEGPSSIGVDTLITSFRAAGNKPTPELNTFFRGAGVPKELLDALPGIIAEVKYCSCFICYGEPDRAFAKRLRNDLMARGVSCWLYHEDYTPGELTWSEIREARQKAEKMVVLCSAKSLIRDGVLKEIKDQIKENPDKMVPVSMDNLWRADNFTFKRGSVKSKRFLVERNYADFSGATPYDEALERLLFKGLDRKQVKRRKQRKQG